MLYGQVIVSKVVLIGFFGEENKQTMQTAINRTGVFFCVISFLLLCGVMAQRPAQRVANAKANGFQNACLSSKRECVPASILNSLQFGNGKLESVFANIPGKNNAEKLELVIRRLRNDESTVFPKQKRCGEDGLVFVEDISDCYNSILLAYGNPSPLVRGEFPNMIDGESAEDHLKRVHSNIMESIASGVPPLISLALFVAAGTESDKNLEWSGKYGHTIVMISVNPITQMNNLGFAFQYLDSISGRLEEGYAYVEKRPFAAPMGSNPATKVQLYDSPYLAVVVPAMDLNSKSMHWHRRSIIVLTFIVGEFTSPKVFARFRQNLENKMEFKPVLPFELR